MVFESIYEYCSVADENIMATAEFSEIPGIGITPAERDLKFIRLDSPCSDECPFWGTFDCELTKIALKMY
ncbi:hypothetical protein KLL36_19345 [Clostridioides difficile]|uniref:hypothetical protein n=1 Tax=Clostridioides difficile TaxID=1496 RepID=UPI000D1D7D2B|nr:hypothetical protein [Clostridioides difficile]EJA6783686.1 hypothetical protein [Clostridioides difficile]MCM4102396.1 hypothetical protein [Clostridioides difficile]MDL5066696.1 hypothetical protein [Clostridioides difficile]MDN9434621.1 hypothetical protein [Clostridioides difficile]MDN9455522.1 hypothetical protein [Clostridioides difficile]